MYWTVLYCLPGDEFLVLVFGLVQLLLQLFDCFGERSRRLLSLQMLRFHPRQLLGNALLRRQLTLQRSVREEERWEEGRKIRGNEERMEGE